MALGWKQAPKPDDPRLKGHETTYQASRGGWFKKNDKPAASPKGK
ncbi:hypothetical protein AB0F46_21630 [Streptomyces sp. NPDC026665]